MFNCGDDHQLFKLIEIETAGIHWDLKWMCYFCELQVSQDELLMLLERRNISNRDQDNPSMDNGVVSNLVETTPRVPIKIPASLLLGSTYFLRIY